MLINDRTQLEADRKSHRKFIQSNLKGIILRMASSKEYEKTGIHGYGVMRRINKDLTTNFGPSDIYPVLKSLERKSFLRSEYQYPENERPRKAYHITVAGSIHLRELSKTENSDIHKINNLGAKSLILGPYAYEEARH